LSDDDPSPCPAQDASSRPHAKASAPLLNPCMK
jgi:hypothetical protein